MQQQIQIDDDQLVSALLREVRQPAMAKSRNGQGGDGGGNGVLPVDERYYGPIRPDMRFAWMHDDSKWLVTADLGKGQVRIVAEHAELQRDILRRELRRYYRAVVPRTGNSGQLETVRRETATATWCSICYRPVVAGGEVVEACISDELAVSDIFCGDRCLAQAVVSREPASDYRETMRLYLSLGELPAYGELTERKPGVPGEASRFVRLRQGADTLLFDGDGAYLGIMPEGGGQFRWRGEP